MKKRTKAANQEAFLAAYAETATITHAAEAAEITRKTHYDWLKGDETYAKRFAEAEKEAIDILEREARRRAVEGVEEPTGWYQGEPGGYVTRYSDTLLIFLLKGARPEKYRERYDVRGEVKHDHRGVFLLPATLEPDEWAKLPSPEPRHLIEAQSKPS